MLINVFDGNSFDVEVVAMSMAAALILGIVIALFYRLSSTYTSSFTIILAVLPILVQSVIMIVNGNLGTSVAVLGAFGLVRFRSAPGSAKEIGYIFFAMAIGLATGTGYLSLAVIITVIVGTMMLVLEKIKFGTSRTKVRELKITIPEDLNYVGLFDDLFVEYTKHNYLERVRTTNMGTMYELSYEELKEYLENEGIDLKEFADYKGIEEGDKKIKEEKIKRKNKKVIEEDGEDLENTEDTEDVENNEKIEQETTEQKETVKKKKEKIENKEQPKNDKEKETVEQETNKKEPVDN